jgi:hypothetical protein
MSKSTREEDSVKRRERTGVIRGSDGGQRARASIQYLKGRPIKMPPQISNLMQCRQPVSGSIGANPRLKEVSGTVEVPWAHGLRCKLFQPPTGAFHLFGLSPPEGARAAPYPG